MTIIDRILQFIDYKGISINKFSKMIGVSNAYFSKQKKNNANIGSQIIEKIVNTCHDISLLWLVMGEGEMLKESKNTCSDLSVSNNQQKKAEDVLQKEIEKLEAKNLLLKIEIENATEKITDLKEQLKLQSEIISLLKKYSK